MCQLMVVAVAKVVRAVATVEVVPMAVAAPIAERVAVSKARAAAEKGMPEVVVVRAEDQCRRRVPSTVLLA